MPPTSSAPTRKSPSDARHPRHPTHRRHLISAQAAGRYDNGDSIQPPKKGRKPMRAQAPSCIDALLSEDEPAEGDLKTFYDRFKHSPAAASTQDHDANHTHDEAYQISLHSALNACQRRGDKLAQCRLLFLMDTYRGLDPRRHVPDHLRVWFELELDQRRSDATFPWKSDEKQQQQQPRRQQMPGNNFSSPQSSASSTLGPRPQWEEFQDQVHVLYDALRCADRNHRRRFMQ